MEDLIKLLDYLTELSLFEIFMLGFAVNFVTVRIMRIIRGEKSERKKSESSKEALKRRWEV